MPPKNNNASIALGYSDQHKSPAGGKCICSLVGFAAAWWQTSRPIAPESMPVWVSRTAGTGLASKGSSRAFPQAKPTAVCT